MATSPSRDSPRHLRRVDPFVLVARHRTLLGFDRVASAPEAPSHIAVTVDTVDTKRAGREPRFRPARTICVLDQQPLPGTVTVQVLTKLNLPLVGDQEPTVNSHVQLSSRHRRSFVQCFER